MKTPSSLSRLSIVLALLITTGFAAVAYAGDDDALLYDFSDGPVVYTEDGRNFDAQQIDHGGRPGWHITGRGGDAHFLYHSPVDLGSRLREVEVMHIEVFINKTNVTNDLSLTLENNWDPSGDNAEFTLDFSGLKRNEWHTLALPIPDDLPALDRFTTYKIKHYGNLPADMILTELRLPPSEPE